MKLRRHQLKLQALIAETIALLCKNGLEYSDGCVIDALIGVTTDDSETFLVKVAETVCGQNVVRDRSGGDDCEDHVTSAASSSRKRPASQTYQRRGKQTMSR